MATPIRKGLRAESSLQRSVKNGLGALGNDKQFVDEALRSRFADSLEIDENLRLGNEAENRWDYLLGDTVGEKIIGLEPHGASNHEISVLIEKRKSALVQLRSHLRPGVSIKGWFWVQSSGGGFHDTGKARRRANDAGIVFVGRRILAKHLDSIH